MQIPILITVTFIKTLFIYRVLGVLFLKDAFQKITRTRRFYGELNTIHIIFKYSERRRMRAAAR